MNLRGLINNVIKEEFSLTEEREQFDILYHGTDLESAMSIQQNGIDMSKAHGGYFGWGFYTTPDIELAKSNYGDFSEGEGSAVLEFKLDPNANILDLRDEQDFELWKRYNRLIYDKNAYKKFVSDGIDGLWDDSFDGVVVYNPNVLKLINIHNF